MRQDGAGREPARLRRLGCKGDPERGGRWRRRGGRRAGRGRGKTLFTDTGCDACHTLVDAGSNATVGPNLDRLAADAAKDRKREGQSPEEYVKAAIESPNSFVVPSSTRR